jgi:hypothetical protein
MFIIIIVLLLILLLPIEATCWLYDDQYSGLFRQKQLKSLYQELPTA